MDIWVVSLFGCYKHRCTSFRVDIYFHFSRSGVDGLYGKSVFILSRKCLSSEVAAPFYIPTSRVQRSQLLHNFTSTYYSVLFIGICVGETWYHSVVLILIYLMDRDIENIFRCFSLKSKRSTGKTSTSASLTTLRPLTSWITMNCGKVLKRWEYQTTLPVSWETCIQVKKQQLELDMKQQNGSNWERSRSRVYSITLLI